MKRFLISCVIISFIITLGLKNVNAAGVVSNTQPTVPVSHPAYGVINPVLGTSWNTFILTIDQEIKNNWNSQDKLAKGLGNANAYSSQAANLDGYHGYDLFALMVGFGVGAQYPASLKNVANSGDEISKKMEEEGDIYAGIGIGAAVNVGINGKLLGLKNIYLNVKYGTYTYETTMDGNDFKAKVTTFGVGINYQWITHKNLIASIVKWRGISFGSGLQYNSNKLDITMQGLDNIVEPIGATGYKLVLEPDIKLGWEAKTYTIPFDVNTSLRLLWLINVNVGAGVDLVFGRTDINIGQTSTAWVQNPAGQKDTSISDGKVVIDASTKKVAPSFFRPRLQAGAGITIGPLTAINLSVTWYVPDGAYAGLSAGIIW